MRVVAGEFSGRKVVAPRGVRPTLGRVRRAILDTLWPRVEGARVLDLYAGSGAMGFEALSRGAALVTWCDASERCIAAIREGAARLEVAPPRVTFLCMKAREAVARLGRAGRLFDIVFFDPPWDSGEYLAVLKDVPSIVEIGGVVVVEHSKRTEVPAVHGEMMVDQVRRYGDTCVTYLVRTGPEALR